ncbi:MAG TPA: hypothetical protein VHR66_25625 [Gemmataceae bacterium]|jgi:hypothetical protein|nr:hypothetical protein [Gemmataceae bacterium]
MVPEHAHSLFSALRRINFHRKGRDPHHNLTDPLEIVAVAIGLKPAFLGGQKPSDQELLDEVAKVTSELGLHARKTSGVGPMAELLSLSPPPVDRAFLEYFITEDSYHLRSEFPVCWIFADPTIAGQIDECERGTRSLSEVLGYPQCCVENLLRLQGRKYELKLDAYRREYMAKSVEELIDLENKGVGPSRAVKARIESVNTEIAKQVGESIVKFPFIHFTACPPCLSASGSPADLIHSLMKDLAFSLDQKFAREFEEYGSYYREIHEDEFGPVRYSYPKLAT